jgi:hypothetical protein
VTSADNENNATADVDVSEQATSTAVFNLTRDFLTGYFLPGDFVTVGFLIGAFLTVFLTGAFLTGLLTEAFLALMTGYFMTGFLAAGFAFVTGGTMTTAWVREVVTIFVLFLTPFPSTSKSNCDLRLSPP